MKPIQEKTHLSYNIDRTEIDNFTCYYTYKFSTNIWLENIDNYEYFRIKHNDVKQRIIDQLVNEFRISLNNVVFGDPAGKEYIEYMENMNKEL